MSGSVTFHNREREIPTGNPSRQRALEIPFRCSDIAGLALAAPVIAQAQSARSDFRAFVESHGHIATDTTTSGILFSNATADAVELAKGGRYFAYPLTGIQCIK